MKVGVKFFPFPILFIYLAWPAPKIWAQLDLWLRLWILFVVQCRCQCWCQCQCQCQVWLYRKPQPNQILTLSWAGLGWAWLGFELRLRFVNTYNSSTLGAYHKAIAIYNIHHLKKKDWYHGWYLSEILITERGIYFIVSFE